MATIYLRSTDGNDADDGSSWALAKATLAAALTAAGDGGTVYVSHVHAESQSGAITLASPGTVSAPVRVLCVNDSTGALANTATVTSSGGGINWTGSAYYYGIQFSAFTTSGMQSSGAANVSMWFDSCALAITFTGGARHLTIGATADSRAQWVVLRNTTWTAGTTTNTIIPNCRLVWLDTPGAIGGTPPVVLFAPGATRQAAEIIMIGVDISNMATGQTLLNAVAENGTRMLLQTCKLGAGVAMSTGAIPGHGGARIDLVNCDSADTQYRYYARSYQGEAFSETTIVRTGGASDGATGYSRKLVSSANTQFYAPLELAPIRVWNETVGSAITVAVHTVTDNVTLTDAEAWVEAEYQGTSGFPLALRASDRAADILATPANQAASDAEWTTTGLTTPIKQKLSVTFTPQERGWIVLRVMLAKASTTMYVCPKPEVTGYTPSLQQMAPDGIVASGEYPAVADVKDSTVYRFGDIEGEYDGGAAAVSRAWASFG